MSPILVAVLFAMFLWWFATGAIFYVIGRPRHTHRISLWAASGLAAVALVAIVWTRDDAGARAAYIGFAGAIILWGWHEMTFLTGRLTGPRRAACAADCGGMRHFRHGVAALLHHELAILANALVLVAICWGADNMTALWTFLLLWAMRVSAKLNLHFGVPNTAAELLPPHLAYMQSFFAVRPINPLFPVSIALATALTVWLATAAHGAPGGSGAEAGYALMATLAALALLEHWAMVLPMPMEALWRWSLGGHRNAIDAPNQDRDTHQAVAATMPKYTQRQTPQCRGLEMAASPSLRAAGGTTVKGG